jgi:hypothetical protein
MHQYTRRHETTLEGNCQSGYAATRGMLAINPPDMADELILVWRDGAAGGILAEGAELASRAREIEPGHSSVSR